MMKSRDKPFIVQWASENNGQQRDGGCQYEKHEEVDPHVFFVICFRRQLHWCNV